MQDLYRSPAPLDALTIKQAEFEKPPGLVDDLIVVEDLEALGQYGALHLATVIDFAKRFNRRVVVDMPTGSSPRPMWEALATMVKNREIDLSQVIWFGHEADWPPQTGTSLDFEQQRIAILQKLEVNIVPIMDVEAVSGDTIQGNYIPMHLSKPEDPSNLEQVALAAHESAKLYDQIVSALLCRQDVVSVGYDGVGEDSHGWGELQQFHLWPEEWETTENTFVVPSGRYTPKGGLWKLQQNGSFNTGNNFVGLKYPEIFPMGLGRRHMRRLDHNLQIFNNPSKALALQRTLAALRGESLGEEEVLLSEFKALGGQRGLDCENMQTCYQVYQAICSSFNEQTSEAEYYQLWGLANRYFGDTPVSKMIKERAALGFPTTLITTTNVVKGIV